MRPTASCRRYAAINQALAQHAARTKTQITHLPDCRNDSAVGADVARIVQAGSTTSTVEPPAAPTRTVLRDGRPISVSNRGSFQGLAIGDGRSPESWMAYLGFSSERGYIERRFLLDAIG
jgi:hypothetical protein